MSSVSLSPESFRTFGDLLKFLRRRQRLTQLELSIAVGYSEAQIGRLEQNQRKPDLSALKALFIPALDLEHEPTLTARLLQLAQSARQEDGPAVGVTPYKGLLFFDELDSDLFFGREALTQRLSDRATDLAKKVSSRFLAVVGSSGSGKSSLVRAGLAVTLRRAGWNVYIFTPTASPLRTLLANYPASGTKGAGQDLMVIDQFEELFTLCRDEDERLAFIERVLAVAENKSSTTVAVIALRADFYSHCAQYSRLREAVAARQQYIGQMSREELRRAIEEPARRGGWEFEPGLVDLLLSDVGARAVGEPEPGALPLLSHALLATWEHRRGRRLTLDGYRASGGVRGAIAETAERVFSDRLNRTQQDLARDIFVRLTQLGEGTEDTRRRAALGELERNAGEAAQLRSVLDILGEARLVALNEDSADIAHEALIREWERLREWLTQDREGVRLHRRLTETAQEWEARGRDAAELYRGARLAQTREWTAVNEARLNKSERAFVEASIQQEQQFAQEREAQRQRELQAARELAETQRRAARQLGRRALFLSGAFALALLFAAIALFFGNQANQNAITAQHNAQQAQSQQRTATSRELAAAAISSLDDDPERSILLALQAESTAHTQEAENALHRAVLGSRVLLVLHHDAEVWSVTYSPDGKRIGTASQDKTAKIWDATTGALLLTLAGHTGSVNGIAYSPDGKRIATASDDHTAKVWDAATGEELLTLSGHSDSIFRIAFSPDGNLLATASEDQTARVWDAHTGHELLTFSAHGAPVFDVGFSPDGRRIATSGEDENVRVWEAASGKQLLTLQMAGDKRIRGVAFSSDGTRIGATSSTFPGGRVWDSATGQVLLSGFPDHRNSVLDIAFSRDGSLIATGSFDAKAKVWDASTGRVLYTLSGHTRPVNGVALSPDGTRLVTASWDHTARVWSITPVGESLFIPIPPPWPMVPSYNPDGTRLVTGYTGGSSVKVWDAVSGREVQTLVGSTTPVAGALYSRDGNLIAAGSDKNIIIWDARSGRQLFTLVGHTAPASFGAFSPDGAHFASGSSNGELIIWDLRSGRLASVLQGPLMGTSIVQRMVGYTIQSLAYSPDGSRLFSGDAQGVGTMWDAATGKKLLTRSTGGVNPAVGSVPDAIMAASYSPDGRRLAVAGASGLVTIVDPLTANVLLVLRGHTDSVVSVAFSPDGRLLATASLDGTAKVWDAASGLNQLTLPVGNNAGSASFSPNGQRLAVGSDLGVGVYILPVDDLAALAKSRLTRTLTTEECQQYLHVESCPASP